jgi:hypothetical protein
MVKVYYKNSAHTQIETIVFRRREYQEKQTKILFKIAFIYYNKRDIQPGG